VTVERLYTFRILDDHNEWAVAIQVNAENEDQARRRAEHYMFSRRTVASGPLSSESDSLVHLVLM